MNKKLKQAFEKVMLIVPGAKPVVLAQVEMWRSEGVPCFQVADGDF